MTGVARTRTAQGDDSRVPGGGDRELRPGWLLGAALDAALAAAIHLLSYRLRFDADQFATFFPSALSTAPVVVACQLIMLLLFRGYAGLGEVRWVMRVAAAIVAGTALASGIVWLTHGFEGISRSAFVLDAVLLSIAALTWRGLWLLSHRRRVLPELRGDPQLVDRAAELTTVKGALVSLYRYRELLKNLVFKELKLKYRGSVFGFLWSLANPLLMMVVYTIAFTVILRVRSEGFVFSLMLGLLSWTFFANSAGLSTGAIVDNAGLLKSVLFPRAILPIGTVLFNLAQYLLTVSVFLPAMMLWYRVPPSDAILLFPLFLLLQVVFTIGVALTLATATAFFRDVRHLLEVALAVLFWTTPIVYELGQVPERLQKLILLSPVTPFVVAYQQIFFHRAWPEPAVYVMAITHATGAFVVGTLLFLGFEDRFTEQL
jgi:lipopolysaccharide transport system permease protein